MLIIFATTKPFLGHNAIIQRNAIQSWLRLRPACEIVLFGDEEGTAEIAAELGTKHVPVMECNEYDTPLLNSMFAIAQDIASHELLCYIASDIILMSDFLPAVQRWDKRPFLIVGQRWDVDFNEPADFQDARWELLLRNRLAERGKLHPKGGISYFVFSRGLFKDIPPLAIGRTGEDNWLIYRARSFKVPVIDATGAITAVHQNHDYAHHPDGRAGVWAGPERKRNIELMGGKDNAFTTEYATHLLTNQGVKPALSPRHIYFRLRALPVLHPRFRFFLALFKAFEKTVKVLRGMRASLKPSAVS